MRKALIITLSVSTTIVLATQITGTRYVEHNYAQELFDVSMPIDSTGYTLHGTHLKGGAVQFTDGGTFISPLLASERGAFQTQTAKDTKGNPLIATQIKYNAIKFINPNGPNNLFIKVGQAERHQAVSGLDPFVLKKGSYTWTVPIFATGVESNDVNHKGENYQFIQVGSNPAYPAATNAMYTQQFYLFSRGKSNIGIMDHPVRTSRLYSILNKPIKKSFFCHADGIWGSGGDPYRTIKGRCKGVVTTLPAGPDLDYEYGTFTLPRIYSPWSSSPGDTCVFPGGKKHKGCTNVWVDTSIRYVAQKIRVPLSKNIYVFADVGTAYREVAPHNLRYNCKHNVYLKGILPKADCMKKSYLPGGASYTFFAVGYQYKDKKGREYTAEYMSVPEAENQNRLTWQDASETQLYAISKVRRVSLQKIKENLTTALSDIKTKFPQFYAVLGKPFFEKIMAKN